jgi:hypothetical protein
LLSRKFLSEKPPERRQGVIVELSSIEHWVVDSDYDYAEGSTTEDFQLQPSTDGSLSCQSGIGQFGNLTTPSIRSIQSLIIVCDPVLSTGWQ